MPVNLYSDYIIDIGKTQGRLLIMDNSRKIGPRATTEKDVAIGHNIRTCRILSGIQSPYIADKLDIKTAQYYKLESGKNHTTLSRALEMANVFNVSVDEFVNNEHEFSKEDLKVIKPLMINFLKIENMQYRNDVWDLIMKFINENSDEKYNFDTSDINNTRLLATAFLNIESDSSRTQIMNFIYAVIKIK